MIPSHNNIIEKNNQLATHENSGWGVTALFLIIINALGLHGLLMSLCQGNNRINKLWEPSEETTFFTVPVFIIASLIVVWIVTPKATQMKKIFKIATIIGSILFAIYSLFIAYIHGLASGMAN